MLTTLWRPLVDEESAMAFLVSARTGELLALPAAELRVEARAKILEQRERLRRASRVEAMDVDDWEQGYLGRDMRPGPLDRLALRLGWILALALARWARLDSAFRGLEALALRFPARRSDVAGILDAVAFAERSFHRAARTQQCLPRTMLRFFLLRRAGHAVEANIGVWVPTPMMHAWVSVHGRPLGEEREEVMHYQPCLRFVGSDAPPCREPC